MSTTNDADADGETGRSGVQYLRWNLRLSNALAETSRPNEKLTAEDVRELPAPYVGGETNVSKLARDYGVSYNTISEAVRGQSWRHVGGPIADDRSRQLLGEENDG